MNNLITYFTDLGYQESSLNRFIAALKPRYFKQGEWILQPNQIENFLSFVDAGIVRYFMLADGKEITFDFAFAQSFYTAYDSFYSRKNTAIYIEAMTDCKLYSITYDALHHLYNECNTAKELGTLATEYLLNKKVRRELSLLSQTPFQRYQAILEEQPKYIQQIPLKYLASYIGVVPESLSRIRKRIS